MGLDLEVLQRLSTTCDPYCDGMAYDDDAANQGPRRTQAIEGVRNCSIV